MIHVHDKLPNLKGLAPNPSSMRNQEDPSLTTIIVTPSSSRSHSCRELLTHFFDHTILSEDAVRDSHLHQQFFLRGEINERHSGRSEKGDDLTKRVVGSLNHER